MLQDPEEAEFPEGQTLWIIPGTNPEAREVASNFWSTTWPNFSGGVNLFQSCFMLFAVGFGDMTDRR